MSPGSTRFLLVVSVVEDDCSSQGELLMTSIMLSSVILSRLVKVRWQR